MTPIRLAILVSHPIQHFAPWHRETAKISEIDLRVYFYCDWGVKEYLDPGFGTDVRWDVPLLDGYANEFLPIARRPQRLTFWDVDNPLVESALDRFQPDVVKLFGYAYRTNWRVARWARRNRRPLMLYSDSNIKTVPSWWKRCLNSTVVGRFYSFVDGAMFVGDNNFRYHRQYGIPAERLFPGSLPVDRQVLLKVVPDSAAVRRDMRRAMNIPQDAFVVLFCGKYIARKRPGDLVQAARLLAANGLPVWAVLVGEGEERGPIEALCRALTIYNVSLTGFVNQSAIPRYYAAADVLAVTSSADPHPLIVSEAACFGLPVIVSDRVGCIGPNDSAQPGVNAIVYPCGDVQALADAIERLWRDRELYQRMSTKSLEIAASQDVTVAAEQLAVAVKQLRRLGKRCHPHREPQPASEIAAS
jgi:glycosyltransferase involved in cell wall biosynthesis